MQSDAWQLRLRRRSIISIEVKEAVERQPLAFHKYLSLFFHYLNKPTAREPDRIPVLPRTRRRCVSKARRPEIVLGNIIRRNRHQIQKSR